MPGIFGIISRKPAQECQRTVGAMLASMMHEPSYLSGTCTVKEVGVYAGWVAHAESFAAVHSGTHQKLGITLVFSGECYREPNQAASESNNTSYSWIVRQYQVHGERFVGSLNGLFSGLLVDHSRRRAFLFNDRYGLERIYVHESGGAMYFASEAKALLRVVPSIRAFDEMGVAQYLAFGCTFETTTLFRKVSLLPPASSWAYESGTGWQKRTYFSPREWEIQEPLSESQFETAFNETFCRVLRQYVTDSDRLGISLTGGLDTRMIMACMPETATKPICYTFSGRTENTLDGKLAAQIALTSGMSHHLLRIGDDFLSRFDHFVDKSVYISDGCCRATWAHELYFSPTAARLAPIRLTGNYGSEVLRSMSTFQPVHLDSKLLSSDMSSALASVQVPSGTRHPVTFAAFQEIPWSLVGILLTGRSQLAFRTPYLDNELVALAYRAPAVARRTPHAALQLIEKAHPVLSRIPTDRGHIGTRRGAAWMLRRVIAEVTFKIDYLHQEGLAGALSPLNPLLDRLAPTGILGRHKFLPYARWFQKELAPRVETVITDPRMRNLSFFSSRFFESMLIHHSEGRKNMSREINAVLTLEAVDRLLLKETNHRSNHECAI